MGGFVLLYALSAWLGQSGNNSQYIPDIWLYNPVHDDNRFNKVLYVKIVKLTARRDWKLSSVVLLAIL